ncbi:MAG TPA: RNA methyltransferase [Terriglobia bacterium]|nr:RNA methyltransferase [Terriglobia bacterium]
MMGRDSERRKGRTITSTANPLVKLFRHALAEGVTREGWLAIEGPHALEEALSAGPEVAPQSVLVSETAGSKFQSLLARLPRETEVARVADALFNRVADTPSPQGIAALVEVKARELDPLLRQPSVLLLVACGVQDPGNLGTMMRSAQALGASALLTLKDTVSPFNPKAARSSAGAIFHLPIFHGLEPAGLFRQLRAAGVRVVASDRKSPNPLHRADLRGGLAFLIGREGSGLPEESIRGADLRLSIPIRPGMDSVNAATAASIFLYEAARQREFEKLSR